MYVSSLNEVLIFACTCIRLRTASQCFNPLRPLLQWMTFHWPHDLEQLFAGCELYLIIFHNSWQKKVCRTVSLSALTLPCDSICGATQGPPGAGQVSGVCVQETEEPWPGPLRDLAACFTCSKSSWLKTFLLGFKIRKCFSTSWIMSCVVSHGRTVSSFTFKIPSVSRVLGLSIYKSQKDKQRFSAYCNVVVSGLQDQVLGLLQKTCNLSFIHVMKCSVNKQQVKSNRTQAVGLWLQQKYTQIATYSFC